MSAGRGRLVFAVLAAGGLAIALIVALLSGSSGGDDPSAEPCLRKWNADTFALSDGAHAYADHGYRAVLVSEDDGRCLVTFATARVEFEPGFGVRVFERGRWASLAAVDKVSVEEIAEMQREATETANATLLPDGSLTSS